MNRRELLFIFLISVAALPVLPVFGSGQTDGSVSDNLSGSLSKGIELYNEGNLAEAASAFRQAAVSDNPETAAAAYYNHGTVQAELAGQIQDPAEKRALLEESIQSLKRAAELESLPAGQQQNVRRNMEIVREQLSGLPESPPDGEDGKQDQKPGTQNQDGQKGEQQDTQSGGAEDADQSGRGNQNEQTGISPEQMLSQQRELSSRTDKGEGSSRELAGEQKKLQEASEDAGLNEAAVNQAKAAKALSQGDLEGAGGYQRAAEQALAEAAGQGADGEAEEILNQEAENEVQRNRLEKMGGITDVQRNW